MRCQGSETPALRHGDVRDTLKLLRQVLRQRQLTAQGVVN